MLQDLNKALFSKENSSEQMPQSSQNDSDEHESTQTRNAYQAINACNIYASWNWLPHFLSGYLIAFSAFYWNKCWVYRTAKILRKFCVGTTNEVPHYLTKDTICQNVCGMVVGTQFRMFFYHQIHCLWWHIVVVISEPRQNRPQVVVGQIMKLFW